MKFINKILSVLLIITIITTALVYIGATTRVGYIFGYISGQSIWFNFGSIFVFVSLIAAIILAIIVPLPDKDGVKYGNYGLAAKIMSGILLIYFLNEPFRTMAIGLITLRLVFVLIKKLVTFEGYKVDIVFDEIDNRSDAQKYYIDKLNYPEKFDVLGKRKL